MKGLVRLDNGQGLEVFPVASEKACASGQGFVSLENLLDSSSSPIQLYKLLFSKRQRYYSALVLASSMLQLHATPWLDNAFDKTRIFFRIDPYKNPSPSLQKVLGGPYVVRTFAPSRQQDQPMERGAESAGFAAATTPNAQASSKELLLRLGVVMLELVFGRAVEAHPVYQALSSAAAMQRQWADCAAATVWCKDVADEAGHGFHSAIARCIDCNFDGMRVDLADRSFMAAFGDKVVQKLDDAVSRF